MSHRELLRSVRKRPGMFFGRADLTFEKLVAYIDGLNSGTGGRLLDGFREYLMLRLNEDSSLWWPHLVVKTRDPNASAWSNSPEGDHADADAIFDVLDEFLAEFPVERSRKRLYHEYFLWKQQLGWFDLDLERFRTSPRPDVMNVDEALDALGITRTALFDLVGTGRIEIFRSGADLFVRSARVNELSGQTNDS